MDGRMPIFEMEIICLIQYLPIPGCTRIEFDVKCVRHNVWCELTIDAGFSPTSVEDKYNGKNVLHSEANTELLRIINIGHLVIEVYYVFVP